MRFGVLLGLLLTALGIKEDHQVPHWRWGAGAAGERGATEVGLLPHRAGVGERPASAVG
jgi:hypothetical protein